MKRYDIYEAQRDALRKTLIKDIAGTVATLLFLGDTPNARTLALDLEDDDVRDLTTGITVVVNTSGEYDASRRETIAEVTMTKDGASFSVKTEAGSVRTADSLRTDDLILLQCGMEMAEEQVGHCAMRVCGGRLESFNDEEND